MMTSITASHALQDIVDAGYAPSLRWLAAEIKAGRVPGRMIGRYWRNWRMTEEDLRQFLENARTTPAPVKEPAAAAPSVTAGLTARGARRLNAVSSC